MLGISVIDVEKLADEAGFRTGLTQRLDLPERGGARFFRVKPVVDGVEVFIVDTPEGAEIASKPEIVGGEFAALNTAAASKAVILFETLVDHDEQLLYLHILRASLGYCLHTALRRAGYAVHEAFVRVKYEEGSFRDHAERKAKVVYRKFQSIPVGDVTLVVADTVATGRSLVEALGAVVTAVEEAGSRVSKLVVYGFISEVGLGTVARRARELGIRHFYAIALQDLTPLASNMYDMPLYGPDESAWSERGELRTLAAVVDISTLSRMAPIYAPGMDQPGDWSERQSVLFNGHSYEAGDIAGHLKRSLELLRALRRIAPRAPWYKPWHDDVFREREEGIIRALARLSD